MALFLLFEGKYSILKAKESKIKTVGAGVPFERIRRITGYLVGDMDRWNNAKRAEERDRVKHRIGRK